MPFQIGDKVAHPIYGAGILEDVIQKKVDGVARDYYVMRLPSRSMEVMIPKESSVEMGVRPVVDRVQADKLLAAIPGIQVEMTSNWNRRYQENLERLKSGNLIEVARVVKGLTLRDSKRGLSTGERKMLQSARQILVSELVLSKEQSHEEAEQELNTALA
ncbi:MAG: CarD family transcriptional regulator [Lawsonibacter sp.]|nr:CarD family transcriptional regulator [Lawsonibacter sp.]